MTGGECADQGVGDGDDQPRSGFFWSRRPRAESAVRRRGSSAAGAECGTSAGDGAGVGAGASVTGGEGDVCAAGGEAGVRTVRGEAGVSAAHVGGLVPATSASTSAASSAV